MDSINDGEIFRYILKPWNNKELKEIVGCAADIARESLAESNHFVAIQQSELSVRNSVRPQEVIASAQAVAVDVLVVDDDKSIYELIKKSYDASGQVYYANSLEKALSLLEANANIGILVTDVKVNKQPVAEMVTALKFHYPFIVTIAITSLADSELLKQLINQCQVFRFMIKPPSAPVLMGSIQQGLDKHHVLKSSASEIKRYQVDITQINTDSAIFKRINTLGTRLKAKLRALFSW